MCECRTICQCPWFTLTATENNSFVNWFQMVLYKKVGPCLCTLWCFKPSNPGFLHDFGRIFPQLFHLRQCCLGIATGESNASSYFGSAVADALPLFCKSNLPQKKSMNSFKERFIGSQSKCRWCHCSLAIKLCYIYLLYKDKLKQKRQSSTIEVVRVCFKVKCSWNLPSKMEMHSAATRDLLSHHPVNAAVQLCCSNTHDKWDISKIQT